MPIPQSRAKAVQPRSKSPANIDQHQPDAIEAEQQEGPQMSEVEKSMIRLQVGNLKKKLKEL